MNQSVSTKMARAAAAALAATTLGAAAATADDAVTAAAMTTESGATAIGYTRSEARDASMRDASGNVPVVLHYGADIRGAETLAQAIANEEGITIYALPGGRSGEIELFVAGKRYGQFTQDDLNGAIVSIAAYRAHSIEAYGVDPYEREQPVASLDGAE